MISTCRHCVVEGGAQHSTLSMNMHAHGNVAWSVNDLYYNSMMLWRHGWKERDAIRAIIAHYKESADSKYPDDRCISQIEFTHARATSPPSSSSSKVNHTHATWIMRQVELLLRSKLKGVGKNAGKPITALVVAAYK